MTIAYKLCRLRKDGTIGPLFINARQRIPLNKWVRAEDHPRKGFAHRPGWHCVRTPEAPHLTMKGRVWCRVEISDYQVWDTPAHQGGNWFIANKMKVIEVMNNESCT